MIDSNNLTREIGGASEYIFEGTEQIQQLVISR